MRYIAKGAEPRLRATPAADEEGTRITLSEWRQGNAEWKPSLWRDLQNPMKEDLWKALLCEQGHVCCYCGTRIRYGAQRDDSPAPVEGSHIEHVLPREHFAKLMFEYGNLLISCQAELREPHEPNHCGNHKANWPDDGQKERFIAPTRPDCETYFRYLGNGHVEPDGDDDMHEAARETIKRLNLNAPRLRISRRAVMDALIRELEFLQETPAQLHTWVREYLEITPARENGYQVPPFLAAIRHRLRKEYGPDQTGRTRSGRKDGFS